MRDAPLNPQKGAGVFPIASLLMVFFFLYCLVLRDKANLIPFFSSKPLTPVLIAPSRVGSRAASRRGRSEAIPLFSCEEPGLLLVQLLEGASTRAVKSFAETLSMRRRREGGRGANVRTKTSACEGMGGGEGGGVFFFCGPHMERGAEIKAAGFVINCGTIIE